MALCKLLRYLLPHLQNGNKDRNDLIGLLAGLSRTRDISQLAWFLVLSKCCHFEMKNCHVWGKCHLSPKLESEGERLQTSLGADVDIRLMTAGRPALNTLRAPYVWATSLLGL